MFIMPARIKTMEPSDSLSWTQFEDAYNEYGSFKLVPAFINEGKPYPDVELSLAISKKQIVIKNAWEVSVSDIEQIAIYPEDNILVPEGIVDPPFKKILESKGARSL